MKKELVLIVDFGGQYSQLIARRVRENNVYCEIIPYSTSMEKIKEKNPKGIIFSGGPNSVYGENTPKIDKEIFEIGVPVLGICYGQQLTAFTLGGKVESAKVREYGKTVVNLDNKCSLFEGIDKEQECWMSHTDYVSEIPSDFNIVAYTDGCKVAAMANEDKKIYGVQFHPEVEHTPFGKKMLKNFLFNICELKGDWSVTSFAEEKINEIRKLVGDKKVICALSGGVDSSVAAVIVHKAIGDQLTCIFVDHGLLRKDEGDQVESVFKEKFQMNLIRVNAQDRFLGKLKGVTEPERKRKIIGEEFIRVFEEEANKLGKIDYLVQGTIYPDVVESGTGTSATIKSHHNVGGLPEDMEFELIEPFRTLYKDQVREVGIALGMPDEIIWRQPFPGPGLAIRIIGEITEEKLDILREADAIIVEEIRKAGLYKEIWQSFAVLPTVRSVGVTEKGRTYAYPIVVRAVISKDAMSADWARLPYELMDKISSRIVSEVEGVNRVVYDITPKPPGTIEWE